MSFKKVIKRNVEYQLTFKDAGHTQLLREALRQYLVSSEIKGTEYESIVAQWVYDLGHLEIQEIDI